MASKFTKCALKFKNLLGDSPQTPLIRSSFAHPILPLIIFHLASLAYSSLFEYFPGENPDIYIRSLFYETHNI